MKIPFIYEIDKWLEVMEIEDVLYSSKPTNKKIVSSSKKKKLDENDNIKIFQKIPEINAEKDHQYNSEINNNIIEARKLADTCNNIDELKLAVSNFRGCNLRFAAKNTVFSDGNKNSDIMLIGEAPGASEDEFGIPFCGQSGKLLDEMLYSIGIFREKNCYITNTVFWRPPANRQPTQDEIDLCKPFVEKHIALFNPKILVLVGGTAVTSLLGKQFQISKIRSNFFEYTNMYVKSSIKTTAIFHPAYLLRNPIKKKDTWYDLLMLKEFLSI